jgi:hypothetical protein
MMTTSVLVAVMLAAVGELPKEVATTLLPRITTKSDSLMPSVFVSREAAATATPYGSENVKVS